VIPYDAKPQHVHVRVIDKPIEPPKRVYVEVRDATPPPQTVYVEVKRTDEAR